MDHAHLDPFIASAEHVLAMRIDTSHHDPSHSIATEPELIASVGMTGTTPGTLAATFPRSTALRIAGLFAGTTIAPDDDDTLADAIAEITDIIAGRAATGPHHRTTPTVTIRRGLLGASIPDHPVFRVACCCAAGEFSLAFRPAPAEVSRIAPSPSESATARHQR